MNAFKLIKGKLFLGSFLICSSLIGQGDLLDEKAPNENFQWLDSIRLEEREFQQLPSGFGEKASFFKRNAKGRFDGCTFIHDLASPSSVIEKALQQANQPGILLTSCFPSLHLKPLLLSCAPFIEAIIFSKPPNSGKAFFTFEERSFIHDLKSAQISVYWADEESSTLLKYCERKGEVCGLFVPADRAEDYEQATLVGLYGSHLTGGKEGELEKELTELFLGLAELKAKAGHALLNPQRPLALLTGGGPGAMEIANKVAKETGLLSCARTVDFSAFIKEAHHNPFVEARMTYQMHELADRQAAFHLDLPIFVMGGIGTDFELGLEEAERKMHPYQATPVLLFGESSYWEKKVTSRFQCNVEYGTIKGGEWISNCFICVASAKEALEVYSAFAEGHLTVGRQGPIYPRGFCIWSEDKPLTGSHHE